jgi:hypothetical protein
MGRGRSKKQYDIVSQSVGDSRDNPLWFVHDNQEEEKGCRMRRPARDYAPVKVETSDSVKAAAGSTQSARDEREYDRAFNEWAKSKPGTPEAIELLHKWMAIPTC